MIILTVIQAATCFYVLLACVLILNRMTYRTHPAIITLFVMLTVAGGMGLVTAVSSQPNFVVCFFAIGVSLYLGFNNRRGRQ